jgi:DNA-binding TFAR19-related protein (PDSD5 family)
MSDPYDLTAEQAREIILDISRRHGWVAPQLRESQNEDARELLDTLRLVRESLGDVIETYVLWPPVAFRLFADN